MNIKKCDECKKVLDPKKDEYYSLDNVSFHRPKDESVRLILDKENKDESVHKNLESWTNWIELDFCVECFRTTKLEQYL